VDEVNFDAVEAQVRELSVSLRGADEATVAAEVARLKELASRITDEQSRSLALIRAEKLPEFISGPKPGTSPQYWRAAELVTEVVNSKGSPADRIAAAEQAKSEIAALSKQAPQRESMTILRMNSTLVRLIERLHNDAQDSGS
jgi:hypothetical protein